MRPLRENIEKLTRLGWYTSIIVAAVLIDRLTKYLAVALLRPVGDFPLIKGVIHLTYVENIGAAFGMMREYRWIFMTASTAAIICICIYMVLYCDKFKPLFGVALSLIAGGGIGNMIDRVFRGYVVDFINFELINFAVFNGADSFICVGAALMLLYIIIYENGQKQNKSKGKKKPKSGESGPAADNNGG